MAVAGPGVVRIPGTAGGSHYSDQVATDEQIEKLRLEVEELRHQNEDLKEAVGRRPHRVRRITSWVLIVLACILAISSVLVVYVRNEVLNTATYVSTVQPLAANPAVQQAVASEVTEQLFSHVNVKQEVADALPPKASFLAAPISSGLQTAAETATLKVIQSSQFQKFWVESNRQAHSQLVALLTGSTEGALTASRNGTVSIDLGKVVGQVVQKLDAQGITVFNNVPTDKGPTFVLFKSAQLAKAQRLVRALNHLALVLPLITLALFAGAVAAATNRRKGLVRAAFGLALAMGLLLVVLAVARNQYLVALGGSYPVAALAATYDAVVAAPRFTARTVLVVALLIAIGGALAGNPRVRLWAATLHKPGWLVEGPFPRVVTRYRKFFQWAALLLGLVVLVIWNEPTPLVAVIVLLVALALVGLIGLYGRRTVPVLAGAGTGAVSTAASVDRPSSTTAGTAAAKPAATKTAATKTAATKTAAAKSTRAKPAAATPAADKPTAAPSTPDAPSTAGPDAAGPDDGSAGEPTDGDPAGDA